MLIRPTPYIGITDFMTGAEARAMLNAYAAYRSGKAQRLLMVGVMMSYKTSHGLPTKYEAAFPKTADVPAIFVDHPMAFNTLHYADYDGLTTEEDMGQVMAIAMQGHLHAVQFDMVWPYASLLARVKSDSRQKVKTVLQIGEKALDHCRNDPAKVCQYLQSYGRGLVDYVLLDKSMGKGKGMDAAFLLPFIRAIADTFPGLGIAEAGGLGPTTMHLAEPVIQEFPWTSIDAQSKLRPSGNALDPIDWKMASTYLKKASELFP